MDRLSGLILRAMTSPIRSRRLAAATLVVAAVGATCYLGAARAADTHAPATDNLTLQGDRPPSTVNEFLTAVTKDVDDYWTGVFKQAGRDEPRVTYAWIPPGQTAASACGDGQDGGTLGDSAAAYCMADDTIYISEQFATDIATGSLDRSLPGSANGYGGTYGDFAVAYVVAHEYGHQIQAELGLYERYGDQLPTSAFELQADCYAGTWANHAYENDELDDGDVEEALNAAQAVGDFDASNPQHHGTPEQRADAWSTGFQAGDPSVCNQYLQAV
jgi:predicted metalloprotease